MSNDGNLAVFGYIYNNPGKSKEMKINFPDFPDIEIVGNDILDIEERSRDELIDRINQLAKDRAKIPVFKKNFQVRKDQEKAKKDGNPFTVIAIVLPNTVDDKPVRFNIIANKYEINHIDKAAKLVGKSRSRFLVDSALESADKLLKAKK